MFEVVEIPWSALPEDFFPEDVDKVDLANPEFKVFAKFAYRLHADEWASGENRVWDSGYLVVREVSEKLERKEALAKLTELSEEVGYE